MSRPPTRRTVRCTVAALLLASGTIAFDSHADPVLIGDGDVLSAANADEDRLPEALARAVRDAAAIDLRSYPSPLSIDEIRVEGGALVRRQNWNVGLQNRLDGAQGPLGNFGNAMGQGEPFSSPLMRDYGDASAYSAVGPGTGGEQGRPSGARNPANAAEAMFWETIDNAVKLVRDSVVDEVDAVSFSIAGVDFSLTLSGGRPALLVNSSDLWPAFLSGSMMEEPRTVTVNAAAALHEQGLRSDPVAGAAGSLPGMRAEDLLGSGSKSDLAVIIEKLQEFFVNPFTIFAAVGGLLMWFSFELVHSIREQRRQRRFRRREARRARAAKPA